jgi:endosialidase-like protein
MKTTGSQPPLKATAVALLCLTSGALWAGTEGTSSTFYGVGAGASGVGTSGQNTFVGQAAGYNSSGTTNSFLGYAAGYSNNTGVSNTFLGWYAGYDNTSGYGNAFLGYNAGKSNTTGWYNVFLGNAAGYYNTTGNDNTFIGISAGQSNTTGFFNTAVGRYAGYSNSTGQRNVFMGYRAGYSETGSNKLYIDNCYGDICTSPLIYGEFDNHLLRINGEVGVDANGVAKSQLHFSQTGADVGGWLTSVSDNNFFMSSGAKYDAGAGGWIQKSGDGKAVMAGSGSTGYRVYTNQGVGVGSSFAPASRLHIDYSGNFGLNTLAVAGQPITTGTGAILSAGGAWLNASSRERKENIKELSAADAHQTLAMLSPVSFNYKVDRQEKHIGFIAEDVPEMVASKDRKSLSALDIVAVLTKVVQEQKQLLDNKTALIDKQQRAFEKLAASVSRLEIELNALKSKDLAKRR